MYMISWEEETVIFAIHFTLGAISLPIHILTIYAILFHTNRATVQYARYILFMVVTTMVSDIYLGIFFVPLHFGDLSCIYSTGLLYRVFHLGHSNAQFSVTIFLMFLNVPAIISCLLYRHQAVQLTDSRFKLTTNKLNMISAMSMIVSVYPIISPVTNYLDGEAFLNYTQAEIPPDRFEEVLFRVSCYGVNFLYLVWAGNIAIVVVVICIVMFSVVAHIFSSLRRQKGTMSRHTRNYHRTLTIALIVQVCIPFLFIAIPLFGVAGQIASGSVDNTFLNISAEMLSLHSTAHNLITLIMIRSYREFVRRLFSRFTSRNKISMALISDSSISQAHRI